VLTVARRLAEPNPSGDDFRLLELLLLHGADPNAGDGEVLMHVVGVEALYNMLMIAGADIDKTIVAAARQGDLSKLQRSVERRRTPFEPTRCRIGTQRNPALPGRCFQLIDSAHVPLVGFFTESRLVLSVVLCSEQEPSVLPTALIQAVAHHHHSCARYLLDQLDVAIQHRRTILSACDRGPVSDLSSKLLAATCLVTGILKN